MKRIIVYVSDHGYGHAARTIGLLRQFKLDDEIIVKNSNAFNFIKKSLPEIKVIHSQTDVGPISNLFSENSDSEKTFNLYSNWIKNEKKWIANEINYFKNKKIDLVISDISPMGIRFAKKLGIPSITIANFTWIDILNKLPYHKNKENIIEWLTESYEKVDLGIKLPLSMDLIGLKKIKKASLLYRSVTLSNDKLLKKLNLRTKPITIYLGNHNKPKIKITNNGSKSNIIEILSNDLKINNKIFNYSTEAQNIISASNLVIAKPGYSILSECINSRCPILLIPRKNYPEDHTLCEQSKQLGIGTILKINPRDPVIKLEKFNLLELKNNINDNKIKKLYDYPKASDIIQEFLNA